jgi:ketosteroid isomerase-like protein
MAITKRQQCLALRGGEMQRFVMALAVMLTALVGGTAMALSPAEQELVAVENAWADAAVKADGAAIGRIYADEYLFTDEDGFVWNKSQDIANVTSGTYKPVSYKLEDMRVRIYGDAAVVTGRNVLQASFKGKDISGPYRFTDVFVKRDGRWQCVATQAVRESKK